MPTPKKRVKVEPWDVAAALAKISLSIEPLRRAVEAYYLAWANATPHHPKIYGGFSGWAEAIRSLRDELKPSSWIADEVHGVNYVVSPDQKLAITVASGNEHTGLFDPEAVQQIEPKTKNDKGPFIKAAINANRRLLNLYLFPELEAVAIRQLKEVKDKNARTTWILLIAIDQGARKIRSELSLPTGMGEDECVSAWQDRIILPPVDLDDFPSGSKTIPDAPQSPEINIVVKRVG